MAVPSSAWTEASYSALVRRRIRAGMYVLAVEEPPVPVAAPLPDGDPEPALPPDPEPALPPDPETTVPPAPAPAAPVETEPTLPTHPPRNARAKPAPAISMRAWLHRITDSLGEESPTSS